MSAQSPSQQFKSGVGRGALLRAASAAVYAGTILWVVLHPSGRTTDLLDFRHNAACAAAAAACMAVVVVLYLLASKASAYRGTTAVGCGSSLLGCVGVLVAAFTLVPESWSQQELGHFVGNALWVTIMPGMAVFVIGLRRRRAAKGADQANRQSPARSATGPGRPRR